MKEHKVWNYIKDHKKEIIVSIGATAAGVAIIIITKKKLNEFSIKAIERMESFPKLDIGKITYMDKAKDYTEVIVSGLKVDDLGPFGKELLKIDGIKEDSVMSSIMYIMDNKPEIVETGKF